MPGVASVVKPLNNMTSPKVPFSWTPACKAAFKLAKSSLEKATSLAFPVNSAPIHLSTDASNIGVGAVLEQMTDSNWWPLTCWSRKLTPTEQAYSTFDKYSLEYT